MTSQSSCVPHTFSSLSLFGAEILNISAIPVTGFSYPVLDGWRYSQPSITVDNATFCNITVTYTHPSQNDTINAEVWLPTEDEWNGRLQGIGGGGWVAGRFVLSYAGMAAAIVDGYATSSTDAGLDPNSSPGDWGLISPGNLNLVDLDNFGQRAVGDLANITKNVIKQYYGRPADFTYWNACSNGGRQSAGLAQQYPDAYDGIIAAAPALYWAELATSSVWPAVYMDLTEQYPKTCELEELTARAISKCDALDGVKDGIIADPSSCREDFSAWDHVGTTFNCSETQKDMKISHAAASVAEATWKGPHFSNGDFMWYGYEIGVNISTLASSICTEGKCVPSERATAVFWYQQYVAKDLTANITSLSHAQYDRLFTTLRKTFGGSIQMTEPRIADFQAAGGKMITYHGLADPSITPNSSLHYYREVSSIFPNVTDFYRYYRVPGLQHCWGGNGGQPIHLFDQLRRWVENGTAPESSPVNVTLSDGSSMPEVLCPWPKQAVHKGNNSTDPWTCK